MRVSLPLTAERGRIRAALVAAFGAVAVVALLATLAAPAAHAAFTVEPCKGSAIQGEGSSLQAVAQNEFWIPKIFYTSNGCGGGAATTSPVTYIPNGSGCGIASMGGGTTSSKCSDFLGSEAVPGYRDKLTRFAGSDGPLTPAQKANAENAGKEHAGVIHQIPVASAAVAVVVHFPNGCTLKDPGTGTAASGVGTVNGNATTGGVNDPTGAPTGDTAAEETLRTHITAAEVEKIWDGATQQTWGDVIPVADMVRDAKAASPKEPAECAAMPVIRLVRLDGSGTTYNFKAYLSLLPGAPTNLWTTAPVVGESNVWPINGSTNTTPVEVNTSNNVCEDSTHICHGTANGGGHLATAVQATDGSIGYLDLATARHNGFDIEKKKDDHTYWIPLQTINPSKPEGAQVGTNYVEPTASPGSNIAGSEAPHGANCTEADYRGIPTVPASDPTLGDWSKAIATGSLDEVTYPACALTYDFAWDDDAPVYGNSMSEQLKARTVKDYLTAVESDAGQFGLASADYGTLGASIRQIAQNGVAAIDWEKSAGSGGSKEEAKSAPTTTTTTTATTTNVIAPPSNVFSIAGVKVKGDKIVLSLVLPDAGNVQVKAVGGKLTVSSVSANVSGGNGTVMLAISKAALNKIAKVKGHKLGVKITVTFTPTGGTGASETKTLTLTQALIAGSKAKHSKKKKATKGHKKK